MRSTQKKSSNSVASAKRGSRKAVTKAARRASGKRVPSRMKRFVESTPARIVLGASALAFAFVVAKLKHLV
jgi:hypothetical protein